MIEGLVGIIPLNIVIVIIAGFLVYEAIFRFNNNNILGDIKKVRVLGYSVVFGGGAYFILDKFIRFQIPDLFSTCQSQQFSCLFELQAFNTMISLIILAGAIVFFGSVIAIVKAKKVFRENKLDTKIQKFIDALTDHPKGKWVLNKIYNSQNLSLYIFYLILIILFSTFSSLFLYDLIIDISQTNQYMEEAFIEKIDDKYCLNYYVLNNKDSEQILNSSHIDCDLINYHFNFNNCSDLPRILPPNSITKVSCGITPDIHFSKCYTINHEINGYTEPDNNLLHSNLFGEQLFNELFDN